LIRWAQANTRVRTEAAFRKYKRDFKITKCTTNIMYKPEYKETSLQLGLNSENLEI